MKIVFLSPEAVFPANTGGRIVVYNKIKFLHDLGHEIYLFCIVDCEEEIEQQEIEMEKHCSFARYYNRNSRKANKYLNSVTLPFAVGSRKNKNMQNDITNLLEREDIDLIVCEFPQMAENIRHIKNFNTKRILSLHNIESQSMRSLADTIHNPIKQSIYRIESKRFQRYEEKLFRQGLFDAYTFVSSEDQNFFINSYEFGKKPTFLVPIGAEDHGDIIRSPSNSVIIVGKMSYLPNVEGVIWFYKNVWPKVKRNAPSATLFIVGKDPDERIKAIVDNSVIVTGTVESVAPYYVDSSVAVIPLFSGGGVKTKLIEAVSYKVPVVCTTSGAMGTDFKNNEHIIISDDPDEFAAAICDCLEAGEDVNNRVKNAYKLFQKQYTWKGIIERLNCFLFEITR